VAETKANGYNPRDYYYQNPALKEVLDMIGNGYFSLEDPARYRAIVDSLLNNDNYLLLADYASYIACQDEVSNVYKDQEEWSRRAILNVASMAKFSSDRTICEYADKIWQVKSLKKAPV